MRFELLKESTHPGGVMALTTYRAQETHPSGPTYAFYIVVAKTLLPNAVRNTLLLIVLWKRNAGTVTATENG